MKNISIDGDIVYFKENFLSDEECDKYFNLIRDIGFHPQNLPWEERVIEINNDPIVEKTKNFLNTEFNLNLVLQQAQIQNHHVNSFCGLHTHDAKGRETTEYNSLIYLNDNFEGGQFITKKGISLKPKKGMLTFFNGNKVCHGVNRVYFTDRKTIILWWQK